MFSDNLKQQRKALEIMKIEFQKEEILVMEKKQKIDIDMAIIEAKNNLMGKNKEHEDSKFIGFDEFGESGRMKKSNEEYGKMELIKEKETHLLNLQKNLLKRENELVHKKSELNAMNESIMEKVQNKFEELENLTHQLKEKEIVLKNQHQELKEKENHIDDKIAQLQQTNKKYMDESIIKLLT
jgi:hypothetical protein